MPFRTEIEVRFGDCDPAGIVYYPNLFHYCHVAFEDCWPSVLGVSYAELIASRGLGFPTAHVETDFLRPVRYGDRVEVTVAVERIGTKSAVFVFAGSVDGRACFRASMTKVCANLDSLESLPIPDDLRAALESLKE